MILCSIFFSLPSLLKRAMRSVLVGWLVFFFFFEEIVGWLVGLLYFAESFRRPINLGPFQLGLILLFFSSFTDSTKNIFFFKKKTSKKQTKSPVAFFSLVPFFSPGGDGSARRRRSQVFAGDEHHQVRPFPSPFLAAPYFPFPASAVRNRAPQTLVSDCCSNSTLTRTHAYICTEVLLWIHPSY